MPNFHVTKRVGSTVISEGRLGFVQKSLNVVGELSEGLAVPQIFLDHPELEAPLRRGTTYETVLLLVDLTPFSTVARELTPQGVKGVLQHFYADAGEAIDGCGGVIERFLGDGLVALFGAPFDNRGRGAGVTAALLAATRVQLAVEQRFGGELEAKASIVSGECFFGWLGTDAHPELTVVGNPLTTLFRLEDLATRGQILLPETDYRYIAPAVGGADRPTHVVGDWPQRVTLKGVGSIDIRVIHRLRRSGP